MSTRAALAPFVAAVTTLALIFAIAAQTYSRKYALTPIVASAIYSAFLLLAVLAILPGFLRSRPANVRLARLIFIPLLAAPYLVYALGTGDFHKLALLKLVWVPALLLLIYLPFPVRNENVFGWQDLLAACLLAAAVLSGILKDIWTTPVNLDFMTRLFLIACAAWTWSFVRPVPKLGYRFSISKTILLQAGLNFALFAIIAVPLSLALDFTRWHPRWHGAGAFCLEYLEIFLFIALLEELFFRGFLQSLLAETWRDWRLAQFVVACIFGLFHIFHAPFPNGRYVALATLAGWFYGSAFRKTGNITASALVHAAVDTAWRTWLSAR